MSLIYPGQTIFDYYTKYLNSPDSFQMSHWGSKRTQERNFTQVTAILKQYRPKTLLDVGSGMGSIQSFLPKSVLYSGIDIVPEVVEKANQPSITLADIKTYHPNKTFEAVIALGSFNMGVTHEDFLSSIKQMHHLCTKITIVTASYLRTEEVKDVQKDGWCVIRNHPGINWGNSGDSHVLIKIK